ncbi:MAG: SDR family NAD(P)-dependent oxidoreductase [Acidimicrobiales bacterium]|nr:SDR family NAD(P)-dependent oxidoreductase [Acidimicrobiales bacterium]
METMKNRVAVVTGAASGIGKALSLAFAAEGSSVVLADVEDEALAAAKAEVEALGVTALAVKTDVTDEESVADLCSATLEAFGEVHILCNNAGVGGGGLIKNQQLVDWKWVIDVSLWGVINGLHHFLPHLIEAEDSHVVSTASVAGLMAVPGLAPYNAAKYGVVAIMETLHHEMMRDEEANLGVSVLCPGVVRTNIATAQRNRPEHLRRQKGESGSNAAKAPEEARKRNSAIAAALENGMEPSDVASQVINAIYDRRFWVLSHPELLGEINHRNQELAALKNPTLISDFT